ncbi:serine/threonine-protein kinase [Urbifossiella limnaea]|uniref:Serine/threonine-protein kinase PknD n=1 Tax=Urbifossiella limnaea TaxID=2528023 RepID=A0A517XPX7_9BACT|nr:serine/threonine-protein kinase [Urbifossiella limnaea]QDU19559.1 Serine/threonine-protein kinase PknD [Urbifossiella limnaea]
MSFSDPFGTGRPPPPPRSDPNATRRDADPERTVRRPGNDTPSPFPGLGGFVVPGFEVLGEIARGGMGVVFAARELALGREVAIKTLLPEFSGDALAAARFAAEVRTTARLPHPGVPPVYRLGLLADGRPFMAMKLIRGRTLAAVLAARWQRPASRSTDDLDITAPDSPGALQILEQVCQAVGFAHARGVVHRDLKPANVMVGPFGEVQVMDWGLALDTTARQPDDLDPVLNAATGPDQVIVVHRSMFVAEGTPAYMAPEQARGGAVDARADVFALGGVLCAVLTGRPPFTGRDADDVLRRARLADLSDAFDRLDRSDAAPELVALAKSCLAADADERPPDAGVVTSILIAHRTGWEEKLREFDREQAAAVARSGEARKTAWAAARAEYEAAARGRMWRAVVALAVLSSALAAGLALTHMAPEAPSRGAGCSP